MEPNSRNHSVKAWLIIVFGLVVSITAVALFLLPMILQKESYMWLGIGVPAGIVVLIAGVVLILGGFNILDAKTDEERKLAEEGMLADLRSTIPIVGHILDRLHPPSAIANKPARVAAKKKP